MSNYRFRLVIKPEDIYNRLLPEQKEQIKKLEITDVDLLNNGDVILECLALTDTIAEYPNLQRLLSDGYITVV